MKHKDLLVNLDIHHKYWGAGGFCNKQGINYYFHQNNMFCIHLLLFDYGFSRYIHFVILSWEKICQTLLLIFLDTSFGLVLELRLLRGRWIAAWFQSSDYSECDASLVTPMLQAMESILCFWNSLSGLGTAAREVSLPSLCHLSLVSHQPNLMQLLTHSPTSGFKERMEG